MAEVATQGATPPARRTVADLAIVTGGRFALLAAWFAATAVVARSLGPASLGLYALCGNAIRLATGLAGDPLDAAVMRSAPLHLSVDRPRALAVVRAAFHLRSGLGLGGLALTAAVPWAVSWAVFDTVDHRALAILTAAGVLGDLLLRSALGYLQIAGRFGRLLAADAVWQLGRAGAIVVLAGAGHLTAGSAVGVYVAGPFVAFAVAVLLLPADVTRAARPVPAHLLAVVHHAKWIAAATALGAVYERLDLFLLKHFRGDAEVGLYAGAVFLAAVPDFIDGAVQTVLAPRVAPAFAAGRFNRLAGRYLAWSIPLGLTAGVTALALARWGLRLYLGGGYAGSVPVFRLLVVGTLFNLVATPLSAALLNYVAPRTSTALTGVGLAVVAVGGLAAIPRYGATGAAAVIVAARVVVGLGTVVVAARLAARAGRHTSE